MKRGLGGNPGLSFYLPIITPRRLWMKPDILILLRHDSKVILSKLYRWCYVRAISNVPPGGPTVANDSPAEDSKPNRKFLAAIAVPNWIRRRPASFVTSALLAATLLGASVLKAAPPQSNGSAVSKAASRSAEPSVKPAAQREAIPARRSPASDATIAAPYRALLNQYCVVCHNEQLRTAGLVLSKLDVANVPEGAETWEKVIGKLRTSAMPPPGMPRPDKTTYDAFASYLETTLDRAAIAKPNPGRVAVHRLNRAEYTNA